MKNVREFDFSDNKMPNWILKSTKNFNFSSDAFPVTKIHWLITPKNWNSSIEKLPLDLWKELSELYTYVSDKVEKEIWWKTCYFEHWESWSTINWGSCNNHAHLHILNSWKQVDNYNEKVLEEMNKILNDYKWIKVSDKDIIEINWLKSNFYYLDELKYLINWG